MIGLTKYKIRFLSIDSLSLLEQCNKMWEARKFVASLTFISAVLSCVYAFLATPTYLASTIILPPQQQASGTSMLSMLSAGSPASLVGAGGVGAALGLKNPNDIYIAMLNSRRIGDSIINRYDLMAYFKQEYRVKAFKRLASRTKVVSGKDGTISIDFEDKSPALAAKVANEYVKQLLVMNQNFAAAEATQRREFYESQLAQIKDSLAQTEIELRDFQERTGVFDIGAESNASGVAMANLRAQISEKEVQLRMLAQYASQNNAQVAQLKLVIAELRSQLRSLTKGSGDDVLIGKSKAPTLGLEYLRKAREMKYFESLFEITAKQYEIARMDEASEGASIRVIDYAVTPELRNWPNRVLICGLSIVVGFMAACICVISRSIVRLEPEELANTGGLSG